MTVAPGTFLRISATSASATVVASNILCGPTGTLKRVSGTPAVMPPSAIDLRADEMIAGDIFISAFMNLTGDCIDADQARESVSLLDGAWPSSSTGGGSAIAGVPFASMSLIAMKACAPDAPSTAAWWTRWSIAKLPFGIPGMRSSPSMM